MVRIRLSKRNLFLRFVLCAVTLTLAQSAAITQWVPTGCPSTEFTMALAVSGTNVFAGAQIGGVCFSSDNGTTWSAVNTGLTNTSVFSLAVSGTNLYAGTYGGGVFLSTNNGTSWTASGLTNNYVWSLAISGTNLFAGTDSGVFL